MRCVCCVARVRACVCVRTDRNIHVYSKRFLGFPGCPYLEVHLHPVDEKEDDDDDHQQREAAVAHTQHQHLWRRRGVHQQQGRWGRVSKTWLFCLLSFRLTCQDRVSKTWLFCLLSFTLTWQDRVSYTWVFRLVLHTYLAGSRHLHMGLSSSVIHTYLAGSSQLHMALLSSVIHTYLAESSQLHMGLPSCHSHLLGRIESVTHGSSVLSFTFTWQDRVSYTWLFHVLSFTFTWCVRVSLMSVTVPWALSPSVIWHTYLVRACVVNVIVKCPELPPCVVYGRDVNSLHYYCYYYHHYYHHHHYCILTLSSWSSMVSATRNIITIIIIIVIIIIITIIIIIYPPCHRDPPWFRPPGTGRPAEGTAARWRRWKRWWTYSGTAARPRETSWYERPVGCKCKQTNT